MAQKSQLAQKISKDKNETSDQIAGLGNTKKAPRKVRKSEQEHGFLH